MDVPMISLTTVSVFLTAVGGTVQELNWSESPAHTAQGFLEKVAQRLENPAEHFPRLLIDDEVTLDALFQTFLEAVHGLDPS